MTTENTIELIDLDNHIINVKGKNNKDVWKSKGETASNMP